MRRLMISAVSVLTLSVALAAPVFAAPPDGACPRAFNEATYAELLDEFPQVPEAFGEEAALALLMSFDNNGNGTVCWIAHPPNSRVFETKVFVANVIDDNAVGLD